MPEIPEEWTECSSTGYCECYYYYMGPGQIVACAGVDISTLQEEQVFPSDTIYLGLVNNNAEDIATFVSEAEVFQIRNLKVSANPLSELTRQSFSELVNLETLELLVDQMEDLPNELEVSNTLSVISLRDNPNLQALPERLITQGESSLASIEVIRNPSLKRIPGTFFDNLPNLVLVEFSDNNLQQAEIEDISFGNHPSLMRVSFVYEHGLTTIRREWFRDIPQNMGSISFWHNDNIHTIEQGTFDDLHSLQSSLSLSYNALTDDGVPDDLLDNLNRYTPTNVTVYMYGNRLTRVPVMCTLPNINCLLDAHLANHIKK